MKKLVKMLVTENIKEGGFHFEKGDIRMVDTEKKMILLCKSKDSESYKLLKDEDFKKLEVVK